MERKIFSLRYIIIFLFIGFHFLNQNELEFVQYLYEKEINREIYISFNESKLNKYFLTVGRQFSSLPIGEYAVRGGGRKAT